MFVIRLFRGSFTQNEPQFTRIEHFLNRRESQ